MKLNPNILSMPTKRLITKALDIGKQAVDTVITPRYVENMIEIDAQKKESLEIIEANIADMLTRENCLKLLSDQIANILPEEADANTYLSEETILRLKYALSVIPPNYLARMTLSSGHQAILLRYFGDNMFQS